ncbi:MAG: hypothetical protein SGJ10_05540 [Bacteroidota bacterium]|nr:hypothetical protein [Bacteroidota bacterium]
MKSKYNTKLLLLIIAIVCASNVFSQTHNYSYKYNNPYNVNNFTVGVYTGLDFSVIDAPVGLQFNYMISRLSLEAKFARGFLLSVLGDDSDKVHGIKPLAFVELTGAIHLVDKAKTKNYKFVLAVSQGYSSTTTTYLPVPVYVRKIFGIRGGLMRYNINGKVGGKDANNVSYTNYYNMATTSLYGGLLLKTIQDFKINVEGFRKEKGKKRMREFYLDFMFSPKTNINPTYLQGADDQSTIVIRNTGFRMGWQWRSTRAFGGHFRLEFGMMPGYAIPKAGLYTMWTTGFNISTRVAPKGDAVYAPKK